MSFSRLYVIIDILNPNTYVYNPKYIIPIYDPNIYEPPTREIIHQ